jgi:hypothetical protein
MAIFLDRVDSSPLQETKFPFEFESWVSNLVDSLNKNLQVIQDALNLYNNGLIAPSFTTVEIAALDPDLDDGVILYDSTLNLYVGKISGTLVQFTTAAYP